MFIEINNIFILTIVCVTQYNNSATGGGYMPNEKEIVEGLVSELRRGTVVLSVLSQLGDKEYGYSLVQLLAQKGMAVEANTLYPLLRRLEGQGLLRSEWDTDEAKPRKYYSRTPLGDSVYAALKKEWKTAVDSVAGLTKE